MATDKITGVDVTLSVNTGTTEAPTWKAVGAQRNATLNLSSSAFDITSKDSGGWEEKLPGINSWNIAFDGLYVEDDAAYIKLEAVFMARQAVQVKIAIANKTFTGFGRIGLNIAGPYNAEATISGTVTGAGKLTKS